MWFKNLIVYRLPADWSVAPAELEEKLAQRALQPCGSFDMQSRGWLHASAAERFVHTTHGQHLIALGVEQKLLPSSIVRQVASDRAKVIEQQLLRPDHVANRNERKQDAVGPAGFGIDR